VIAHFSFVPFVLLGGLLVLRWRLLLWLYLPVALWGVFVELMGWTCPLTPLENRLRTLSGEGGYTRDFITHYLLMLLYPEGLTHGGQITLGLVVLLSNVIVYARVLRRERGSS
jgi:hypothetical protein